MPASSTKTRGNRKYAPCSRSVRGNLASVISFVVPAYNEERLLGRTLAAIHTAARELGRPYELIVADDASTDRTAGVACDSGAVGGGASVYIDGKLPVWVRLFMPPFRFAFRTSRLAAGCYLFCRRNEF